MKNIKENYHQEHLFDFSIGKSLRETQVETLSLLKKVSKGKDCFQTTLDELTENFYAGYRDLKKINPYTAKKLKTRIRCRLDYFEAEWQKKNNRNLFEIVSKKCADGCASIHTKQKPNPDILTIRLYFV